MGKLKKANDILRATSENVRVKLVIKKDGTREYLASKNGRKLPGSGPLAIDVNDLHEATLQFAATRKVR